MKHLNRIILSAMMLSLLALTGCTKEVIVDRYVSNVTNVNGATMKSIEFEIQPEAWVTQNNINYYYVTYNMPDITKDVEDYGAVVAYMWGTDGWNQLPYIYPYHSNDANATYPESLRFDWRTNEITFILQDLDGGLPEYVSDLDPITVRVCIFYNN